VSDRPRQVDIRSTAAAGAAWATLVVVLPAPAVLLPVAVATGVACVVALAVGVRVGRRAPGATAASVLAFVALLAGAAAVVTGSAAARLEGHRPEALVALRGHVVVLEGVVSGTAGEGAKSLRLGVDRVTAGAEVWSGRPVSVRVLSPRLTERVAPGERVRLRVALLDGLGDDGPEEGGSVAFLAAGRATPVTIGEARGPWSWLEGPRSAFRAVAADLPGDGGALLPGLVVGDTSAVDDDLDAAMKTASLTHLTAVSGSNCAVLVAAVTVVGGLLRWPRTVRVVVAIGVLGAFLLVVTAEASIVRATVMAVVVLVHAAAGRPLGGLPVLALAVTGLLLVDPWWARDVGFALSVLATGGLVVLSGPLAGLLSRVLPEPLALVLAIPAAAQLACQPVLLVLEPVVPVHGVTANLLAAPAAPLATGLGLVALLLAPWAPDAAGVVAGAAWLPASWIGAVARTTASWPAASASLSPGAATVAGAAVACGLVAALVLTRGRVRVVVAAVLVVAVVVVGGSAVGRRAGSRLAVPGDWAVAQCDVGQGDAVLLRSAGAVALVDVGDDEPALRRCLDLVGVDRVDLLVLTHFDRDHVGAVAAVVDRVDAALVGPQDTAGDRAVVDGLTAAGVRVTEARPGDAGTLGELGWRVLWPPDGTRSGNDASVTTRWGPMPGCSSGCLSLLDLGDLGETAQRRLLASTADSAGGPVDVLKVAHHGSADTSPQFVRTVAPRVALIGVGADNSYGHPTPSALETLAEVGATVTRTDQDGTAVIVPGPDGLRLWRERR